MTDFDMRRNANGFTWGPLQVICEASHKNSGVYLALETRHERVDVRVTPKGFIRLGTVRESSKSRPLPAESEEQVDPWALLRELYDAREAMGTSSVMNCSDETFSRLCRASSAANTALKRHDESRGG